ncbi:AI-2E family transporter [Streptomyces sp. CC228A]|uniref:AI-2E family transporter n=1 Tax=Streptomyces sp. CC228A TaxID=2898186 RepID=UPI001F387425|nr:AI-2E family transporter [Streptomyces sp. CC228A]
MSPLPEPVRRLAAWCVVVLLVTAVAYIVIWLCVTFQTALTAILLAVLGAALLRPVHRRLVDWHVQRSLAAGLTCVAVVAVFGGAGYIVVTALIDTGDQIVESLRQAVRDLARLVGAPGTTLDDLITRGWDLLRRFGGGAASGVVSGISLLSQVLTIALLALLLLFFFLRDSGRVLDVLRDIAPGDSAGTLEAVARRAFEAVEGFMRGTTIVALIDGVFITIGLLVLQVPGAFGLGALVFVGAYIPYLGAFLSGAVAVLVALADRGLAIALWTLGVVLAVQTLEGNVLQPVIQSRTVRIHPAVVLVALTAGASVAGILGMLLAVPFTAAAVGIAGELRSRYGRSGTPAGSPPAAPDS